MNFLKRIKYNKLNLFIVVMLLAYTIFVQIPSFKNIAVYVYSDSANYASLGLRFAQGNFEKAVHVWWLPFYPFMGGVFYQFTKNIEKALLFVSVFSGILLVIPVFYLTYEFTKDRLLSGMAALLAAFNVVSTRHYTSLLTENLYALTLVSSCYLSVFALRKNSKVVGALAGVCFGLAFMTRNEAAVFVIFFWFYCLLILLMNILRNLVTRNVTISNAYKLLFIIPKNLFFVLRKIKPLPLNLILAVFNYIRATKVSQIALISFLAFFLTISPYFLLMSSKFGYLNMNARAKAADNSYKPNYLAAGHKTTWAQDVWSVDTLNYHSPFFKSTLKKVKLDLYLDDMIDGSTKRAKKYIGILREEFGDKTLMLMVFGLVYSFGLFAFKRNSNNNRLILLNLFLISGSCIVLAYLPGAERRYLLWIYPFMYVFIFIGFYSIKHLLKEKYVGYVITIVAIYFFVSFFKEYLIALPPAFGTAGTINDYIEVSEFIKSQGKTNPRIMSRREAVAYYANGETIFSIDDNISREELKNYLRHWRVDYIVANLENIGDSKGLSFLLDEKEKIPDWLKIIKEYGEGRSRIIIYEVLDNI